MNGCLLDTNVISELTRDAPEPRVVSFLAGRDDIWVSSLLIHEVEYGLRLLPNGRRRERLSAMLTGIFSSYARRILPLDRLGAEWAAEFRARSRAAGHSLDLGDALIAGIARANGLAVATRNVRDFNVLNIDVVNPWESQCPL